MATAKPAAGKGNQQSQKPPARSVSAPSGGSSLVSLQEPEFLARAREQGSTSRGNENVTTQDIIIPRLELVQALSPCKKRNDPQYIEGAEDGMMFNNLTRELYGDELLLLPIFYRKEYLVWVDRKKHPGTDGFRGSFPTAEAAAARVAEADEDDLQIIDTGQQFCLIVHSDKRVEEIVVSMARTKMKVCRRWNSLIRLAGGDRFSRIYKMTTVEEKNKRGDFHNFAVEVFGFPSQTLYNLAEEKYKQISRGGVVADVSGNVIDPDDDASQDGTRRSGAQDY